MLALLIAGVSACAIPTSSSDEDTIEEEALPTLVPVKTPPVTPKFQRDFNRSISLMQKNKNRSALKLLTLLTQNYPQFAGPHVNIGLIYFRAKQFSKAKKAFEKALSLNPNNAVSHNHLGIIQRKNGEFKAALKSYRYAILSNADYANAHLNIGVLYDIYFSNLTKALEHYQRYLDLTGNKDKKVSNWIIDIKRRVNAS